MCPEDFVFLILRLRLLGSADWLSLDHVRSDCATRHRNLNAAAGHMCGQALVLRLQAYSGSNCSSHAVSRDTEPSNGMELDLSMTVLPACFTALVIAIS